MKKVIVKDLSGIIIDEFIASENEANNITSSALEVIEIELDVKNGNESENN
jgi:hypothetical protein